MVVTLPCEIVTMFVGVEVNKSKRKATVKKRREIVHLLQGNDVDAQGIIPC